MMVNNGSVDNITIQINNSSTCKSNWTHFRERDFVIKTINEVFALDKKEEVGTGKVTAGCWVELLQNSGTQGLDKVLLILEGYQEQPHLLDPTLEQLVSPATSFLLSHASSPLSSSTSGATDFSGVTQMALQYLYVLFKVRGRKTMQLVMPHEIEHFQRVFLCLLRNTSELEKVPNWMARYVIMTWASFLIMLPFDWNKLKLAIGDTNEVDLELLNLEKRYLQSSGKDQQAVGFLLARHLVRSPHLVETFLSWSHETVDTQNINQAMGILQTQAEWLKVITGRTIESVGVVQIVKGVLADTMSLMESSVEFQRNSLLRKLLLKIAQRCGMIIMGPVTCRRGVAQEVNADVVELDESVESIIQVLLQSIADKDTIVRWSAAKGIGRVCARLPTKELFSQVFNCIPLLGESDHTDGDPNVWHGVCLTLAEIIRQGLLEEGDQLASVIPFLKEALCFEVLNTAIYNNSTGQNVRDAACYVCYSLCRAYSPLELSKDWSLGLIVQMVKAAVLDREVQCRRAAAAALQEWTGRTNSEGIVPHGIDLITRANYFTVGPRASCIEEVSVSIARDFYTPFGRPLIEHVRERQIRHPFDHKFREECSLALAKMLHFGVDMDFAADNVNILCQTLEQMEVDEYILHGVISTLAFYFEQLSSVLNSSLPGKSLFLKQGNRWSPVTLASYFRLIRSYSMKCSNPCDVEMMNVLLDSLGHADVSVREMAVSALEPMLACTPPDNLLWWSRDFVTGLWIPQMKRGSGTENLNGAGEDVIRKIGGFGLLLGSFPRDRQLCLECGNVALDSVFHLQKYGSTSSLIIEARCSIVRGIVKYFINNKSTNDNDDDRRQSFLDCSLEPSLLALLDDYSVDNRGDVGSWMREEALKGLVKIYELYPGRPNQLLFRAKCMRISVEKLDRIRFLAFKSLYHEISSNEISSNEISTDDDASLMGTEAIFDRIVHQVMTLEEDFIIIGQVVNGLILSAGGLSESLAQLASSHLQALLASTKGPLIAHQLIEMLSNPVKKAKSEGGRSLTGSSAPPLTSALISVLGQMMMDNTNEGVQTLVSDALFRLEQTSFDAVYQRLISYTLGRPMTAPNNNFKRWSSGIQLFLGILLNTFNQAKGDEMKIRIIGLRKRILRLLLSILSSDECQNMINNASHTTTTTNTATKINGYCTPPRFRHYLAEQFYLVLLMITSSEGESESDDGGEEARIIELLEPVSNALLEIDWLSSSSGASGARGGVGLKDIDGNLLEYLDC